MATLAVYRGDQLLRKVELGDAPMRIGRAPENEIVLEDTNKGVSRTHAEIRPEGGNYVILDLNSQNGVWIRDRRVKVEPLPVDEPVTVGPYRLVLLPSPAPRSSGTSIPGTMVAPAARVPAGPEPTARVEPAPQSSHAGDAPVVVPPVPPKPAPVAARATPPKPAPGGSNKGLIIGGVAVAAIAAIAVFAMLSRSPSESPTTTTTEPPPQVAQATTTVPPAPAPTDEDRFREHFDKAQALIQAGDKAGATAENTAALAILPNDDRGVKQRAAIDAIGAPPPAPAPTPTPETPGPATPASSATATAATAKKKEPIASSLTVTPRANESASERAAREKTARSFLDDGKRAFEERRFADAIDLLQRAIDLSDRPDFGTAPGEAAAALKQARTSKAAAEAAQARASAQKLFDQAKSLAGSDIVSAVRRLREALAIDKNVQGGAELMASLQEQLVAQGEAALTSAKNFDRVRRTPDAIREYDRAAQLLELAGGHKDLALARQRSAELKGR